MGFLDRMLGDLIGNATGLPARRVVRMVGGKNLLLLGGAAVAGALLAEQMGKGNVGAAATRSVPPPVPGGTPHAPPPPPPLPTPGNEVAGVPPPPPVPAAAGDELPPGLTYALARATVAAALADGEMDPAEKRIIQERLGESDLDESQVRQIHQDLVVPASPRELADMLPGADEREAAYRVAALVVLADERVTDVERAWLERLARTFGFDEPKRAELETEVFGK